MSESDLFLRPGIEITNRIELKYAHAVSLLNQLTGRIGEWSAAENLLARVHQVDEHRVELRLVINRLPPIDEWSLILGDTLHNFRSVFDTIIWAFATLDGAIPNRPKQVSFPVTKDEGEWKQRIKNLESVPPQLLERVRQLQSWPDGQRGTESLLWHIHRLDNLDKHQGLISGALHVNQVFTGGLNLNLEPSQTASEAQLKFETRQDPVRAEEDAVVTSISCDTHALSPNPSYLAKVEVQFRLEGEDDRGAFITTFGAELAAKTREYLDLLCGGQLFAQARALARSSTEPSVVHGYYDQGGELHVLRLPLMPPD